MPFLWETCKATLRNREAKHSRNLLLHTYTRSRLSIHNVGNFNQALRERPPTKPVLCDAQLTPAPADEQPVEYSVGPAAIAGRSHQEASEARVSRKP